MHDARRRARGSPAIERSPTGWLRQRPAGAPHPHVVAAARACCDPRHDRIGVVALVEQHCGRRVLLRGIGGSCAAAVGRLPVEHPVGSYARARVTYPTGENMTVCSMTDEQCDQRIDARDMSRWTNHPPTPHDRMADSAPSKASRPSAQDRVPRWRRRRRVRARSRGSLARRMEWQQYNDSSQV